MNIKVAAFTVSEKSTNTDKSCRSRQLKNCYANKNVTGQNALIKLICKVLVGECHSAFNNYVPSDRYVFRMFLFFIC